MIILNRKLIADMLRESDVSQVLENLEKNNIYSVNDFLLSDVEKLCSYVQHPMKTILEMKKKLIEKLSCPGISGFYLYGQNLSSGKIPTFIKNLDELLNGGMNSFLEICGLSGSGKTQLCMTIAVNIALNLKFNVLYLDTKDDFSANRMYSMLKNSTTKNTSDIDEVLKRIHVLHTTSIHEILTKLYKLKKDLMDGNEVSYKLIIIDSMTVLNLPYILADHNEGLGYMCHIVSLLRTISVQYNIIILLTNLGTMFYDQEEGKDFMENGKMDNETVEIKPLLGKFWWHVPNTRLSIKKCDEYNNERILYVIKSTNLPLGKSCLVKILESGVE